MKTSDKKIMTVLLEWDYGIRSRGPSLEKTCFVETLKQLATSVETLWYDDYLDKPGPLQESDHCPCSRIAARPYFLRSLHRPVHHGNLGCTETGLFYLCLVW